MPLWAPYPRGERVPYNDPDRRAVLAGLDLTQGAGAVRRAAFEASGFVVRRMLDAIPVESRRIVATGGGTRVDEWVQALADCTGMPVDCVAVPEGRARLRLARPHRRRPRGAAGDDRGATVGPHRPHRRPDARWTAPTAERYAEWKSLA